MSQVKLIIRPLFNVDFVTGYPGIPPSQDRPQATVKGTVEVRVTSQGVQAKWVRIELRKVETLPGGGPANTYYDVVGPSPVSLWGASDKYSPLHPQDFPFSIRIPESAPPTVALGGKASIEYELLASVCTKGKKGFLRKAKSVVTTTTVPIIIDKHELHSTWPVYQQPETRHLDQNSVNLIVERTKTCFGPGDKVAVVATVMSNILRPIILRGLEMSLKETIVFHAGNKSGKKLKNASQAKQANIFDTRIATNMTLYGGMMYTSELSCMIQSNHTTTSLIAARHIDITYTLCVKAVMGDGADLVMNLPVVMSNWPRHVSREAIKRIGTVPNLSLTEASSLQVRARKYPWANSFSLTSSSTFADESINGESYGLVRLGNSGLVDEIVSRNTYGNTLVSAFSSTTGLGSTSAFMLSSSSIRLVGSHSTGSRLVVHNSEVPQTKQRPTATDEIIPSEQMGAEVTHDQEVAAVLTESVQPVDVLQNEIARIIDYSSDTNPQSSSGGGSTQTTDVAIHAQAISAPEAVLPVYSGAKTIQHLSIEEERTALRRYAEGRRTLDRMQTALALARIRSKGNPRLRV